jgi:dihydrofolate reductase
VADQVRHGLLQTTDVWPCRDSRQENVVVSHGFQLLATESGCVAATGIAEALAKAEAAHKSYKEIFVIGGQSMYEQFAPLVDRYLITVVHKPVPTGDTFFDESLIGDMSDWVKTDLSVGAANTAGDEALYEIFELVRKDVEKPKRIRSQLLDSISGGRPSPNSRRFSRTATSRSDASFPVLQL